MRNRARIPQPQRHNNQAEHEAQDPPPRQERHRHRPQHNEEQRYGKLKFTMPKFNGSNDPEEYLSWALKFDKIFRLHNYEEEKKITMASLEFHLVGTNHRAP